VIATNAKEETKIRSIVYAQFPIRGVTKTRKPPEGQSPGTSCIVKVSTSVNPTMAALAISLPDRVQHVAAVRYSRDLIASAQPAPAGQRIVL
jgi:hypothetical protein